MHFDHTLKTVPTLTKCTLMDCLYFTVILVTIYGHIQLVFTKIKLILPVVHVTQEAQTGFLPMLAMTTTVSLGIMVAVLLLCFLMSCAMDSSVIVWRLCTHPNMPWFIKTLSETTTDKIELRACTTNQGCHGTVPVFLIEIYVR